MYRVAIIFISLFIFSSSLLANESIVKRQEAMQVVRSTMKILGPMANSSTEHDPFLVETTLENMLDAMKPYNSYFPSGSEAGNKTQATAKIWETKDDFEKLVDNFIGAIASALDSDLEDKELFAKNFEIISKNCRSCHMNYRSR